MKKGVNWSVVGAAIMGVLSIIMFGVGCVGCSVS